MAMHRSPLAGHPYARVIEAGLREPEGIRYHTDVLELLDFSQPVAVPDGAGPHFVPDSARRWSRSPASDRGIAVSSDGE